MRKFMIAVAILTLLIVPNVSAAPTTCSITPKLHPVPTGHQIAVQGSGFQSNEPIKLSVTPPVSAPFTVENVIVANEQGNFLTEIGGDDPGTYSITAAGLTCVATATVDGQAPTPSSTPKPTAKPTHTPNPTVPPTPNLTLPPTDTE